MKRNRSYLFAVALWAGVAAAPVMAEEASDFYALSQIATNVALMTRDQLATTEGGLDVGSLLGGTSLLGVPVLSLLPLLGVLGGVSIAN